MTDTERATIVAVTGEDGRFGSVRRRAIERARETGARLILYDVDASGHVFESPTPTVWSGDVDPELLPDRLGPDDLDVAGRHAVAQQVLDARAAGVETWAWLPERKDAESLAGYAVVHRASLLLVPEGEADLGAEAPVPIEAVPSDGR